eukprot:GILI01006555.1.p1 GENE.GILI01006555.1~~GILI01006555.1.p1  ORF type:complete len:389 (+),score=69.33 GILI01006555.1:250-1416(+)
MGSVLPKPILSKVIERVGSPECYGGCCSINGYRTTMEDAHCMKITEDRMLFGIFDGHSNDRCSQHVAEHLPPRILNEPLSALTKEKLEQLCIDVDEEFLNISREGGSTGTFCIVDKATLKVTICNVGDSRIMLVRDGNIVFVTSDHKPMNLDEKNRIEEAGGVVRMNRVDGDLAVSRAFGDGQFKRSENKDPRKQKVIAVPDITVVEAQKGDILVLACDGVFESNFSNPEVAQFVTENMPAVKPDGTCGDVAVTCARVCDQAIKRGSKDNISCMVVHFADGTNHANNYGDTSFVPGPPFPKNHEASKTAYSKMAYLAHSNLPDALRIRHKLYQAHLTGRLNTLPDIEQLSFDLCDEVDVNAEGQFFGAGPPTPEDEISFFVALAEGTR